MGKGTIKDSVIFNNFLLFLVCNLELMCVCFVFSLLK